MFLLPELLVLMLSVRLIALKILIPMHYWPVAINDMQSSSIWQMEDQGKKCLKVVYIIYLKCTSFLKVIMEKDRRGYRWKQKWGTCRGYRWREYRKFRWTHVCCSTSEPSQSSSRRILSLKDSSTLLNIWESLKDETCLLLLWDYSSVTLHTFVFIHIISVVQPMYIFKARNKVSKSCLMVELFFHRFKYFVVFRYICLVFTTNRVLRIRRTSLFWYSSLRCSVQG